MAKKYKGYKQTLEDEKRYFLNLIKEIDVLLTKAPDTSHSDVGAIRNLKGGTPPLDKLHEYRYLIASDAAVAINQDPGNLSKDIKSGKVKAKEMQIFVKDDLEFYPLGTKVIQAVDMTQFEEVPPKVRKRVKAALSTKGKGRDIGKGAKGGSE